MHNLNIEILRTAFTCRKSCWFNEYIGNKRLNSEITSFAAGDDVQVHITMASALLFNGARSRGKRIRTFINSMISGRENDYVVFRS